MIVDKNMEVTELYDFIVTINDGFCTYEYTLSSSGDYSIYDVLKSITNTIKLSVKQEKFLPQTKDVTPESDAMELVNKLRLGGFALNSNDQEDHGPNGDDYHFEISDPAAARLLDDWRAVPRAMLEEVIFDAYGKGLAKRILNGNEADAIAEKYGVKIEG